MGLDLRTIGKRSRQRWFVAELGAPIYLRVAVHAINNVVPSFSLFYGDGRNGWNFSLVSFHGLHRPEWNCIDGQAQKKTPTSR